MTYALLLQFCPGGNVLSFLPMIVIFGIFYFLLFRPMQKQKKDTADMLAQLKNGDVVATNGGIVGTIISIQMPEDTVILRVKPDNVKLQLARSAVTAMIDKNTSPS